MSQAPFLRFKRNNSTWHVFLELARLPEITPQKSREVSLGFNALFYHAIDSSVLN